MSLAERKKTFSVVLGLQRFSVFRPFCLLVFLRIRINVNGTNTEHYLQQLLCIRMITFKCKRGRSVLQLYILQFWLSVHFCQLLLYCSLVSHARGTYVQYFLDWLSQFVIGYLPGDVIMAATN